jgi:hypothetical protein
MLQPRVEVGQQEFYIQEGVSKMRIASVLLVAGCSVFTLTAQSISVGNVNNSLISPDGVVGDAYQVTITGAARNALVQLNFTHNGSPGVWYAGFTDDSGYWTNTSAPGDSTSIGFWTEQWSVGGVNIGPEYDFVIIDQPTSLRVLSVAASSPDSCGNPWFVPADHTYGPSATIKYQIVGSTGADLSSVGIRVGLIPYEKNTRYNQDGTIHSMDEGNVGTDNPAYSPNLRIFADYPWRPPSAQSAASDGTYYDVPVGICANGVFGLFKYATQAISIIIGLRNYPVGTVDWSGVAITPGHGSLRGTNGVSYDQ